MLGFTRPDHPAPAWLSRTLCVVLAGFLGIAALSGCGGGTGPSWNQPAVHSDGTTRNTIGDWDDAEAAATVATRQVELAIVRTTRPTPDQVRFETLAASDEAGLLTISRLPDQPSGRKPSERGGESLRATAKLGTFGDARREAALLDRLERRLRQLEGVEHAPLDE